MVSTKPVGGRPEGTTGMTTEMLRHSGFGIAGATASVTGCGLGTSALCCITLADKCKTVTDIQSLSIGQQPRSIGVSNEVFPEQSHFITPTPPAPNTNSINIVSAIIMSENHLISNAKI